MVIYGLADVLDAFESVTIVKVTPERRAWMSKARPEDRFAVALGEGGYFGYGVDVNEAIAAAATLSGGVALHTNRGGAHG